MDLRTFASVFLDGHMTKHALLHRNKVAWLWVGLVTLVMLSGVLSPRSLQAQAAPERPIGDIIGADLPMQKPVAEAAAEAGDQTTPSEDGEEQDEKAEAGLERDRAGSVTKLKGQVEAEYEGEKRALKVGDLILSGDTLITGKQSRMVMTMLDDALISLGEETEFFVEKYEFSKDDMEGDALMLLTQGIFRASSGQLGLLEDKPFQIKTPVAVVKIYGTEFAASVVTGEDGQPRLQVVSIKPTTVVNNDAGTTTLDQPFTDSKVESAEASPSEQTKVSSETVATAQIATVLPRPMSDEAKTALQESTAQSLLDSGIAANEAEAAALAESSVAQLAEQAAWNATAETLLDAAKTQDEIYVLEDKIESLEKLAAEDPTAAAELEAAKAELATKEAPEDFDALSEKPVTAEEQSESPAVQAALTKFVDTVQAKVDSGLSPTEAINATIEEAQEAGTVELLSDNLEMDSLNTEEGTKKSEDEGLEAAPVIQETAPTPAPATETTKTTDPVPGPTPTPESDTGTGSAGTTVYISLDENTVSQYAPAGTLVGEFSLPNREAAADGSLYDYTLSYDTLDASTRSALEISGKELLVTNTTALASMLSHRITVTATPPVATAQSFTKVFIISVDADGNAPPSSITLSEASVSLGGVNGDVIGTLTAVDNIDSDDTETFTYSFDDPYNAANDMFTIDESGQLILADATQIQTAGRYLISIKATDQGGTGFSYTQNFALTSPGMEIALPNNSIPFGAQNGLTIGSLEHHYPTTEPYSYEFVDPHNDGGGLFALDGNTISLVNSDGITAGETYTISVRLTVEDGFTYDEDITIQAVNNAPSDLELSNTTIPYQADANTDVASISPTDADIPAGDVVTLSLVSDDYDGLFSIENNRLKINQSLASAEAGTSYTVTIRATDSVGASYDESFTLTISASPNQAPTGIELSNTTLPPDVASGAAVADITTIDPDEGDTHTYSFAEPYNDAGGRFSLVGSQLMVGDSALLLTGGEYQITLQSTDQDGLSITQEFTIQVESAANQAPTDIGLSGTTVNVGSADGTIIGAVTATDPDGEDSELLFTFSDPNNNANGLFALNQGNLVLADSNALTAGDHLITLKVTDQNGTGLSYSKDFTITAIQTNEAPTDIQLSSQIIPLGAATGTTIAGITATDPDGDDDFIYSFTDPNNDASGLFEISGSSLILKDGDAVVTGNSYDITIMVQDKNGAGASFSKGFTLTASDDPNLAPTDITLSNNSVDTGSPAGTLVGNLSASDPDNENDLLFSFSAPNSDAGGMFQISGSALEVKDAGLLVTGNHAITIQVTDKNGTGLSYSESFTIAVIQPNRAPTAIELSSTSVDIGSTNGEIIGLLSTIDPDLADSHTYSFTTPHSDGGGLFSIVGDQLQVANAAGLTEGSVSITLQSVDSGGLSLTKDFILTVTQPNRAPTDISLSSSTIPYQAPANTIVGTLSTTDPDSGDTASYSFIDPEGDTNGAFSLDGNKLQAVDPSALTAGNSYSVRIRVTDSGGLIFDKAFTLFASSDPNQAPTGISLDNLTVDPTSANDAVVANISATDPDGDTDLLFSFADPDQNAGGRFAINGTTLTVADSTLIQPEPGLFSTYTITLRVTDKDGAGLSFDQSFALTLDNRPPTALAIDNTEVPAGSAVNDLIATLSATDADGEDGFIYRFIAPYEDAGGRFALQNNKIIVADPSLLDPGPGESTDFNITVEVVDKSGAGASFSQDFLLTLGNRAPTDISLSNDTVPLNAPTDTVVAGLVTTDADGEDGFLYSLTTPNLGADGRFAISGSNLVVADGALLEAGESYQISIQVTDKDGAGFSYSEDFTLTMSTDPNLPPTDLELSGNSVEPESITGTVVGDITGTDPDNANDLVYSLVDPNGDADGRFGISGSQLVVADGTKLTPTAGEFTSYAITLRVTDKDGAGLSYDENFNISLNNRVPTALVLSNNEIPAGSPDGSVVGDLTTTDLDGEDGFVYAFADPNQDADGAFELLDGQLRVKDNTKLPYSGTGTNSFDVTIQVTDKNGLGSNLSQEFTITLTNEAPSAIALSNSTVASDAALSSVVGDLSTTDPDDTDGFVYSFTDPNNDAGGLFAISGHQITVLNPDGLVGDGVEPITHAITVQVTDKNGAGLSFTQDFTITVSLINQAPTDLFLSSTGLSADAENGHTVATITATDPDGDTDLTYTFTDPNNDAGGLFGISSNTLLVVDDTLLTAGTHDITLRVTDGGGLSYDESFSITVTVGNQPPTDLALSSDQVSYDATTNTVVATITATDPDGNDGFVYSFADPNQDADGRFTISGDQLLVGDTTSFNTFSGYDREHKISIQVADSGGLTYTEDFTIQIMRFTDASGASDVSGSNSEIATTAKSAHAGIEAQLEAGTEVTLDNADLTELMLGKFTQQMTDGGSFGSDLSDVVKKFSMTVTPSQVTATLQMGAIDAVYDRLPASVQSTFDTLFGSVLEYANDYTASVQFRIAPVISGSTMGYDSANSYVDVIQDSAFMPNLTFPLQDLVDQYNDARSNLSSGGLLFFTGDSDDNGSQAIGTTIPIDQFFPDLVESLTLNSGSVTITPPTPAQ
uniref:Cadherin domain-containing protein n=1 Tax=Magnetococcus massalia (strain MO-1) TaxID=451514 RepID=A0A1S7LJN7_MAGMO|nr:exported protein of unknown function [low similarity to Cadherin] [Candidatus Magnetococcus massalia]